MPSVKLTHMQDVRLADAVAVETGFLRKAPAVFN